MPRPTTHRPYEIPPSPAPAAPGPCFLIADDDKDRSLALLERALRHGDALIAPTIAAPPPGGAWIAAIVLAKLCDAPGLDALRAADPELPVLLIADTPDRHAIALAFDKRALLIDLPLRLEQVETFLVTPEVRRSVARQRARRHRIGATNPVLAGVAEEIGAEYNLTQSESEIIVDGLHGLDRAEMAAFRHVSRSAIKTRVNHVLAKAGGATGAKELWPIIHAALYELLFGEPPPRRPAQSPVPPPRRRRK